MPPRSADVVVTLDGVVRSPSTPLIGAMDPMLVRAAGVFETVLLRAGTPCLLDAHLGRLAASAALVGLPAPDPQRWQAAIEVALAQRPGDGVLRLVHGPRVSFVTVSDLPSTAEAAPVLVATAARRRMAAGEIGYEEFMALAAASAPSVGHCNTMGTALSKLPYNRGPACDAQTVVSQLVGSTPKES